MSTPQLPDAVDFADHPHGGVAFLEAFTEGVSPPPTQLPSEWVEENVVLSPVDSAAPGPYRFTRTPHWREPLDCLAPGSPVRSLAVMKGAQLGASTFANCFIGFMIDADPGPTMYVVPNEESAKLTSRQRLGPMFKSCESLAEKVRAGRKEEGGSAMLYRSFPGGAMRLVGANAASGFRMMPARNLLLDEVDAYPDDVGGEGDPISLAERATSTYEHTSRLLAISTPTVDGRSKIQDLFEAGDQRLYMVACPHCTERQALTWDRLQFKDEPKPVYICEHCEGRIEEHHKREMMLGGVWVPQNPDAPETHRSYHINALYSLQRSWAKIVELFLKAKESPAKLRTWTNHQLGECWKAKGDAPEWEELHDRRENYPVGVVPPGGLVLTAGIDVQKDRIEMEVVAWGAPAVAGVELESWSIDYKVLQGDVREPEVWQQLEAAIRHTYPVAGAPDTIRMPIERAAIDSGAFTQRVYRWCRRYRPQRQIMVVKGTDSTAAAIQPPTKVDVVGSDGRRLKRGVLLWRVGVGLIKEDLYERLGAKLSRDADVRVPAGYCHFPDAYAQEYFRQLTAESLVARQTKAGYVRYQWEKSRERNEALDCRVYAMAAAEALTLPRWILDRWNERRIELGLGAAPAAKPAPEPEPQPPGRAQGGRLSRWRGRRHN